MKLFSCLAPFLFSAAALHAEVLPSDLFPTPSSGVVQKMPTVVVQERQPDEEGLTFPQTTAAISAERMAETVNALDAEDALKYLPSVFLRKRNYGDTQPVMATRTWGVSSSARSLVYADGLLLTALLANNNTIGAPRWGLIAPAEIERVTVMYGPFSAAFPGNSIGAVVEFTTRMPESRTMSVDQSFAWQHFHLYGTDRTFRTRQTAVSAGSRAGPFSFRVSANYQDSNSQPLAYVTAATFPSATTGGYTALNKLGLPANVLGATGLLHTRMINAKFKAAYYLTTTLRATYTFGVWRNDADSRVQSFLRDGSGQPTYAGIAGFASGYGSTLQEHSLHGFSLKTTTKKDWDFELVASRYRMDRDEQRLPGSASTSGTAFSSAGRVAALGGTHWSTLDLKSSWHPSGPTSANLLSVGVHDDQYALYNPTFNTPQWESGHAYSSVATEGDGKTRTQAAWVQDVWQINPELKATVGLRYEKWKAYDGYNANGASSVRQPDLRRSNASPKASLTWSPAARWEITASAGRAYRYATAAELYQLVSTGNTFTAPNADLKPDNVLATELRFERKLEHGNARVSLFQDDVHDAILAQFNPLAPGSSTLFQFISNVDHVRARGAEFSLQRDHFFLRGLELAGSVTYLDATILASRGQGQFGNVVGKRLPNIPDWRATVTVTYRSSERWSFSAAGRYSGRLFTTVDNNDVNPNTYQGFTSFFVADLRAQCRLASRWRLAVGIDNALNRTYFYFHPFPQRTLITEGHYAF